MRQEGINTPTGGGAGVRNRLPRLAMAAVFLALVVAIFAASAGSAQSQTTTELSIVYHSNGDSIAVPGKLHPTDTLAGPDGTEYPVAHDDSRAYFRISRSGGGSLFSQYSGVVAHINFTYAEANRGSPSSVDTVLARHNSTGTASNWDLSEVIGLATSGPLTIELETMEEQPYTLSTSNNSLCIVLHTLDGTIIGDNCMGGS